MEIFAVVGAGPAGLAAALTAAKRGHQVTLFDANTRIGGQFNLARQIPGKEEFNETLRYYARQLELQEVSLLVVRLVGQFPQPCSLLRSEEKEIRVPRPLIAPA